MLVRLQEDGALAIGQLSHAWLSGQLARAWGNERFDAPEPREEIVLGAQQHDVGWALFDLDPGWSPRTGLPRSFLEISLEEHLAIWREAPDRLLSQSVQAALVVSLHGRSLSELHARRVPEQEELARHIADETARQAALRARLGLSEEQLRRTQRQMWTWDGLSLALCHGWQPFTARDVPARDGLVDVELRERGERSYTLDPWPFSQDRLEVRCEARRLKARYDSEAAAREALGQAQLETLAFELARA